MDKQQRQAVPRKNILISIGLCIGVFSASSQALAEEDAIKPGAVLPRESLELPQAEPKLFSIPPMIERPLGEDEGPSVQVKAFRISNPLARPDLGISIENTQQIADNAIQKAAVDKECKCDFTIGQLQQIADQITNHYRQAGLILARAVVPSQNVQDGVVVIDILPGVLGSVAVEGNESYSNGILAEPFAGLVGRGVDKDSIETALLHVTDYPGVELFGVFRPGKAEGETELLLKMQNERRYVFDTQFNNHGSEYTGDYQARINAGWLNPTGAADQLNLALLRSFRPNNSVYSSLAYQRPVFSHENQLGVSYAKNAFDVGQELASQGIEGESQIFDMYWLQRFYRTRLANAEWKVGFSHKRSETTQENLLLGEDNLSVLNTQLKFDYVDNLLGSGGITQGLFSVSRGLPGFLGAMDSNGDGTSSRTGGNGERAGGDFTKFNLSLVRLQQLSEDHSLLLRLESQYSPDLLVSLEQASLGGANNVRAYGPSEYLRDSALFGSVEWIMKAPGFADKVAYGDKKWGDILQVSLFYDAAIGWLNDPLASEEDKLNIHGPGIGLQLDLNPQVSARLDVGFPMATLEPENNRDPQYYFSLSYQH